MSDVIRLAQRHYDLNRCSYARIFPSQVKRLLEAFGRLPAKRLTSERLEGYKAARLSAGIAPATINKELKGLALGYRLALEGRRVKRVPRIAYLRPGRPRSGFVYLEDFERICAFLSAAVRDTAEFAYWTGWRFGEVVGLQWLSVRGGWVWCRSKNGDEKRAPVLGHVKRVIERRRALRKGEHVFHRAGRPIRSLRRNWKTACRKAGLPGLLFHDLRRSFIRNALRAGVDRDTARALSGHRTDAVFRRYNIQDERDLEDGMRRLFLLEHTEKL